MQRELPGDDFRRERAACGVRSQDAGVNVKQLHDDCPHWGKIETEAYPALADLLLIAVISRYYPSELPIHGADNMLDGVSLDQLRAFIAAVDEGSFSAGARRLRRAQSAVSELVSNLEAQIGVVLFDRSQRYPKLTAAGVH